MGALLIVAAACSSDPPAPTAATTPTAPGTSTPADAGREVPRLIIDTDLSRWWDDVTALGVANVLHQRGELEILGIMSDVPNPVAVAAIDAIGTAYGNDDLPLGALAGSDADTFDHGYTDELVARLPHDVTSSDDVPEAVALYRSLLADQPDGSVTIVAIGSYTNLAGLLEAPADGDGPAGRELIEAKVARLVVMDGLFPAGGPPLTNQEIDPAAAQAVVEGDWPTPIAWVDGFVGVPTLVGGTLCTDTAADHPMRIAYEELFACGPPTDGSWDAPAVLYAVGDLDAAFEELGRGGAAVRNDAGGLVWDPASSRPDDVYVHVADQEALNARIDELLVAG